ncbi:MAG: EAL domain-containing protein [Desulfobacterales bacterium]|nr:EAL domain-containing protein [Desulfobacterales bacterium]
MTDPSQTSCRSSYTVLAVVAPGKTRLSITSLLVSRNFSVLEAENSSQYAGIMETNKPDLVLLDLQLPGADPLEMVRTLTRDSLQTPLLVLSDQEHIADALQALRLGAWDLVARSVADSPALLLHAIDKARERAELLRLSQRYQARLDEEEKKQGKKKTGPDLATTPADNSGPEENTAPLDHHFLQTIIDGLIEPAQLIDLNKKVLMMNQAARDLLSAELLEQEELYCYQTVPRFSASCSENMHQCPLEDVKKTGRPVTIVQTRPGDNGEENVCEIKASPLWNEEGTLSGCLEIFRNQSADETARTELRNDESRLYYLSQHDPLTNLPNRMLFQDRLQMLMAKAQRHKNLVAVLFLDLDRFKKINETLGHEAGDKVLREIAGRLQGCLRRSDTVARLSGDEFGIILDDIKDSKYVTVVTRNIMAALAKPFLIEKFELVVSTSIGISLYPEDSVDSDGLMQCADSAMFRAKESGRNNYQFYTAGTNTRAFEFLLLENGLRKALELDELTLYYQPQFDTAANRLMGAEALVRWHHPEKGLLAPGNFIPLAEETGLIEPIGEWVMRTACAQNKAWQEQGFPPITMAVNVSGRQFRQRDFYGLVTDILARSGLDPRFLELELTESIIVQDVEKNIRILNKIADMGIQIAIDDFGTGYSSLSYLRLFPITRLKIDRSFIKQIHTNPNDAVIVSSIIALARNMNLHTTAEGVELEAQLALLHKQDCFNIQGFLFGKPLPAREFVRFFGQGQPTPRIARST